MWKVLRLPMEFFSQRMAGDIQLRKDTNAQIAGQIVNIFAPLLLNTVMMVFYLAVMLRYSAVLTLIGLASVAAQLFLSRVIANKRVNITRVMMRILSLPPSFFREFSAGKLNKRSDYIGALGRFRGRVLCIQFGLRNGQQCISGHCRHSGRYCAS